MSWATPSVQYYPFCCSSTRSMPSQQLTTMDLALEKGETTHSLADISTMVMDRLSSPFSTIVYIHVPPRQWCVTNQHTQILRSSSENLRLVRYLAAQVLNMLFLSHQDRPISNNNLLANTSHWTLNFMFYRKIIRKLEIYLNM